MSGDRYKIQDQQAGYFITMTVVYWIDVFNRRDYKDVIVESLNYCIANKGLNLYAWVIMSKHIYNSSATDYAGGKGMVNVMVA